MTTRFPDAEGMIDSFASFISHAFHDFCVAKIL